MAAGSSLLARNVHATRVESSSEEKQYHGGLDAADIGTLIINQPYLLSVFAEQSFLSAQQGTFHPRELP